MEEVNGESSRGGGGGGQGDVHPLLGGPQGVGSGSGLGGVVNPELGTEDAIIEKTLLSIQEKVRHCVIHA